MIRRLLTYIFCFLSVGVAAQAPSYSQKVECGTWVEISCVPLDDYKFVQWSDGDTHSTRQIQVNEDAVYLAYIAPKCEEYADLPVIALYDWVIMLDAKTIHDTGYTFNENNVFWYRVTGEPDKLADNYYQDDILVGRGYYLTINRNLDGTGDYYAVVDVSNSAGMFCSGLMRSVIIHYTSLAQPKQVALYPTNVYPTQQMRIVGLDPDIETTIYVYTMAGGLLSTTTSHGEETFYMNALTMPGCYNVVVQNENGIQTLRYIVHDR